MKIRFAVAPGPRPFDPDDLCALVDGLERLRFDTIWLSDLPLGAVVDPLVGLSFAAGRTTRLKLGANVVPVGRNPVLLAKELAQLDRLSNGRLLLSFVPGVDHPGEPETLGMPKKVRGAYLEEVIGVLRRLWAGEVVEHRSERITVPGISVHPQPQQAPLEVWLGGSGPLALDRVGRVADGWLGAAVTPDEAGPAVERIQAAARAAGRTIDPEHFGLSLGYARTEVDEASRARLRMRRPDGDTADLLPVGRDALRDVIIRHVDAGLSKFVVRPVTPVTSWDDELSWLADAVLDLQR